MPDSHRTITVDGLAASGKSILSKRLAERLGYVHLNSGLLYRGVAWLAIGERIPLTDEAALLTMISSHPLSLEARSGGVCALRISGTECTGDLTSTEVSYASSQIARLARVRELLLPIQRQSFPGEGVVAEGRDMGTVVFPAAAVKFFIEAKLEVRAARRLAQLRERDTTLTLPQVMEELSARDARDALRDVAPMKSAEDAVLIDNSELPLEQILDIMQHRVSLG
jgi:cytidylate kinase